jgi:hypothetical protein
VDNRKGKSRQNILAAVASRNSTLRGAKRNCTFPRNSNLSLVDTVKSDPKVLIAMGMFS